MGENPSNRIAYLLLLITLVVGVVAFYYREAQAPPEEPVRVFYDSKGGYVIFDHAAHSDWLEEDCTVCHHEDGEEERPENCRTCHEENDIPMMHAYHQKGEDYIDEDMFQSCMSCHESNGRSPDNCKGCHK